MAKFLTTTGLSYQIEELIKQTESQLILISPYLKLNKMIKDRLEDLNLHKRDIRIIYKENKLQVEESNWLLDQVGIRTSLCPSLHAKCYINEKAAIVTSMNLYSFSQQNNDEMGILVDKVDDPKLYDEVLKEVDRLLKISEEIRVSMEKIPKSDKSDTQNDLDSIKKKIDLSKSKLLTTKELSQLTKLSSRKVNQWLTDNKLMVRKDNEWSVTNEGKDLGGVERTGKYGTFVVWPEGISKSITE